MVTRSFDWDPTWSMMRLADEKDNGLFVSWYVALPYPQLTCKHLTTVSRHSTDDTGPEAHGRSECIVVFRFVSTASAEQQRLLKHDASTVSAMDIPLSILTVRLHAHRVRRLQYVEVAPRAAKFAARSAITSKKMLTGPGFHHSSMKCTWLSRSMLSFS